MVMEKDLAKMRHSASHLMALAVQILYPETKFGIGPAIEDGFYYDFDIPGSLSEDDLSKIEKKMRALAEENLKFEKEEVSIKKGLAMVKKLGQPYKAELIKDLEKEGEKKVTFYKLGDFLDLCRGPHVRSTKEIGPFKLLSLAGAYWRGSEKNKMLTRIYGTCFASKEALEEHLDRLEKAQTRDHRKLGKELELFTFDNEVGQGLVIWLPKGAILRKIIMDFALNTYLERGYEPVSTPHIASNKLWRHSGHIDFYKENLYEEFGIEGEQYRLKPMNCPLQIAAYRFRPRSYKELPLRWTEMGTVYRYEKSGVLHGLTRVRGFTQDDAHIICTPEQLHQELIEVFKLTLFILRTFGFKDFECTLSLRDPKSKTKFIGTDQEWETAEKELKKVIEIMGYGDKYVKDVGGAVFYGPKIDIKVADALGRKWQLSTIQFDFNLPSRFKMTYIGSDGKEHTPFMIHRALLGSLERFIGVLIEHYGGAFPVWLAPVQVMVIPITDKHLSYSQKVVTKLKEEGIRVELNDRSDTTSAKIRAAEMQKVPYMLIIGDKEIEAKKVNVRIRGEKVLGSKTLVQFLKLIKEDIAKKKHF